MLNPGMNLGIISCRMVRTRRQHNMPKNIKKTLSKSKWSIFQLKCKKKNVNFPCQIFTHNLFFQKFTLNATMFLVTFVNTIKVFFSPDSVLPKYSSSAGLSGDKNISRLLLRINDNVIISLKKNISYHFELVCIKRFHQTDKITK